MKLTPSDPLDQWKEGDREAFEKVLTLAYDDLRAIATGYLNRAAGHTLQATGLVNELSMKLAQVHVLRGRLNSLTFCDLEGIPTTL